MSVRINTNIEALNAQRNLSTTANQFAKSVEKLSSGLRINRAADDAAGLAISQKLDAQVRSLNQAQRNAQDGISMVQTAEGALNEVHTMLQRIRELAVEASNSTLGGAELSSVNDEMQQLRAEINRISTSTTFNGQNLLTGALSTTQSGGTLLSGNAYNTTGGNATVTAVDVSRAVGGTTYTLTSASAGTLTLTRSGDNAAQTITLSGVAANGSENIDFSTLGVKLTVETDAGAKTAAGLATDLASSTVTTGAGTGSATFQVGANAGEIIQAAFARVDISAQGMASLDTALTNFGTTQNFANAQAVITAADDGITFVSTARGLYGAVQNRLEHTIASIGVGSENLAASESRIKDLDVAAEMVTFTKTQILQQAGTAILAQANQAPQSILTLLK